MNYVKLKEIQEFDCGDDLTVVNERLRAGWVFLAVRTIRKIEDGEHVDFPVYILGLPSE